MSDPDIASNATEFQKVAKAAAELEDQVSVYDKYKATLAALKEAKELLRESDGACLPSGSAVCRVSALPAPSHALVCFAGLWHKGASASLSITGVCKAQGTRKWQS